MSVAMNTGVSGMLAQQRRLDVVANNIANVNTVGYRSSRVIFQDLFSQTLQGGVGATDTFGGTNPMQVGMGVSLGSIDVVHTEGSLLTTGINTDVAIQGNGFFVLSDANGQTYSRDGSFQLNSQGTLVDPASGRTVQGWIADSAGTLDVTTPPGDIQLGIGGVATARATSSASLIGNLDSDALVGDVVTRTVRVYDSLGTPRDLALNFTKLAAPANSWTWDAQFGGASVGTGTLTFNADGSMPAGTTGAISIPSASLASTGSAPADLNITVDYSSVTQLSTTAQTGSDVTLRTQDGYAYGTLESFTVGNNGQLTGVYSNGLRRTIGQVALATFSNVGGLARGGRNSFVETTASGVPQIGVPQTGGRGSVAGGVLEGSNVDLATEFSNLIITQRAFQANSRTITAADTMLQETVNLAR